MTQETEAAVEAVVIDIPLAFYQWLAGIERDVLVWELTPHEIRDLIRAIRQQKGSVDGK